MTIITNINGKDYSGFVGIRVSGSLENLCNQYDQECSSDTGGQSFPITRGSSVDIFIDDFNVFSGKAERSEGNTSYKIKTGGRDSGLSIIKSSLHGDIHFIGPIGLVEIIEKTLKKHGIKKNVINEAGTIDKFTKRDKLNDDVGISIWDYWLALARRRQCLLTLNRDGDIVVFRPGAKKYKSRIINRINDVGGENNIISSNWKFDDSNRCYKYVVNSQYNFASKRDKAPTAEGAQDPDIFGTEQTDAKPDSEQLTKLKDNLSLALQNEGPESELYKALLSAIELETQSTGGSANKNKSRVHTEGIAYDNAITDGSMRIIIADKPSDDDECSRLAKWHCNLERAKSVTYSCVLPELMADSEPWEYGYLIDVIDEDADIDATMLITGFEFGVSKGNNGSVEDTVTLTMTVPDAYSENASVDSSMVRINRIGGNWNNGDFK